MGAAEAGVEEEEVLLQHSCLIQSAWDFDAGPAATRSNQRYIYPDKNQAPIAATVRYALKRARDRGRILRRKGSRTMGD